MMRCLGIMYWLSFSTVEDNVTKNVLFLCICNISMEYCIFGQYEFIV
jgi:hypothetical protein